MTTGVVSIKKIIFACTGNTCRSVMAEALFRRHWNNSIREEKLHISSGGIYAFDGDCAAPEVAKLLDEEGINVSSHRSRRLTPAMIRDAYLIIVMTRNHRDHLLQLEPEAEEKVKLLKPFSGIEHDDPDVADPYGGDLKIYKNSIKEIKECIIELVNILESSFKDDVYPGL